MHGNLNYLIFEGEIHNILASNGDSLNPFPETIQIINFLIMDDLKIFLEQICTFFKNTNCKSIEDFNFFFTSVQSNRFTNFIKAYKATSYTKKYKHISSANSLIENDNFPPQIDTVYELRLARMDFITSQLSVEQYMQFMEMKSNNLFKNQAKIKEHIKSHYDLNKSCLALISLVICYFMKETIICIIDAVYNDKKAASKLITFKYSIRGESSCEKTIYPYYRYGITLNDINNAIGHLFTKDQISAMKTMFPNNPFYLTYKTELVRRDLLFNELIKT